MPQGTDHQHRLHFAHIALGSNTDLASQSPRALVLAAIDRVQAALGAVAEISRFYRTPAFPAGSGPDFVNAAIRIACPPDPRALLTILHGIEADLGRERHQRWGPRTIDLDLLSLDELVSPDAKTWAFWHDLPADQQARIAPQDLILPHPRLQDRAFVLVPLTDIAPDWMHPVLGRTAAALCRALPAADRAAVSALDADETAGIIRL